MFTPDNGLQGRVYGPTLVDPQLMPQPENSARTYRVCANPASPADQVGVWALAGPADLSAALERAAQAVGPWQVRSSRERQQVLRAFAALLAAEQDALARLLTRETGQRLSPGFQMLVPIYEALLGGQAVVWLVKDAPALSWRCSVLLAQAGLPEGVIQRLWTPDGPLALPENVAAFPGVSVIVSASGAPAPMGSPFVLRDEMALDKAVEQAVQGAFADAAQPPFASGLILLPKQRAAAFRTRFLKASEALVIGDPLLNQRVHYGPLPDQAHLDAFLAQLKWGQKAGAKLLSGKGRISRDNKPKTFVGDPEGWYVWPQIWEQVTPEMVRAWPPLAGPTVRFLELADSDAAMALARML